MIPLPSRDLVNAHIPLVIAVGRAHGAQAVGVPASVPPRGLLPAAWPGARRSCEQGRQSCVGLNGTMPMSGRALEERRTAWMVAAQAGDRQAYAALLRDCIPLIAAVAARQGVPPDHVDDVVQETLLALHRARQTYDPRRSFHAWLRTIAQRRSIDILRSLGRSGRREVHAPLAYDSHPDPSADPEHDIDRAGWAGLLQPAIAALPPKQRAAVRHLIVEDRTLSETSDLTGDTKGSLKVNLHRALKTLRTWLSQKE